MRTIKAQSLWQPWAHLIAVGAKRYETRNWRTDYRGPVAIHAAQHWTVRMALQCYEEPFFKILSRAGTRFPARCDHTKLQTLGLDFGAIIAVAELVDIQRTEHILPQLGPQEIAFGDFRHGRFAWLYENAVRLDNPMPCIGKQRLFNAPPEFAIIVATITWKPRP